MPAPIAPPPEQCNCQAIRAAARHVTQFYDQCLAPSGGLRTSQFTVLAKLRRNGPLTINALAGDMVTDRTTLGRNVLPLERDGLITIKVSAADRRAKQLALTKAGEKRLRTAAKLWFAAQAQFDTAFGAKRAAALRGLMATVVASDFTVAGGTVSVCRAREPCAHKERLSMSGLGGLNKTPDGVVIGLVQLQLPTSRHEKRFGGADHEDLRDGAEGAQRHVDDGPRGFPRIFAARPVDEHRPGADVPAGRPGGRAPSGPPASSNRIWGCFSIMEANPDGNPYNTGLILDDAGGDAPLLPQAAPLGAGRAVGAGRSRRPGVRRPERQPLGLIICHDGMFPEMARECAYKGAEIILRTAGYTAPIRHAWRSPTRPTRSRTWP